MALSKRVFPAPVWPTNRIFFTLLWCLLLNSSSLQKQIGSFVQFDYIKEKHLRNPCACCACWNGLKFTSSSGTWKTGNVGSSSSACFETGTGLAKNFTEATSSCWRCNCWISSRRLRSLAGEDPTGRGCISTLMGTVAAATALALSPESSPAFGKLNVYKFKFNIYDMSRIGCTYFPVFQLA